MAESVTLTSAITHASTTGYTLDRVVLDVTNNIILVQWTDNLGGGQSTVYNGTTTPTGAALLHTLNTANFTVNSFVKNVFQRLQTDGFIAAGSISGTPS